MSKATTERLRALLSGGGYRVVKLAYDKRDAPQPWSAELYADGRLVGIRAGRTLQDAITAVQSIDPTGA